ncbi:MAG: PilC/PilY family type IV pilus protein [Candidatus Sedimenticola sp. 6PFRAG5]
MKRFKQYLSMMAAGLVVWLPVQNVQAEVAQVPLFVGGVIEPNIFFTIDDSDSMFFEVMPKLDANGNVFPRLTNYYGNDPAHTDTGMLSERPITFDNDNLWAMRNRYQGINRTYYSPDKRYQPWVDAYGNRMIDADPDCALHNPMTPLPAGVAVADADDYCRPLNASETRNKRWAMSKDATSDLDDLGWVRRVETFWPAQYYNYSGDTSTHGWEDEAESWTGSKYTQVYICQGDLDHDDFTFLSSDYDCPASYPKGVKRTDCAGAACTYTEEMQNYANWYTYYRSRVLLARGAVGRAFADQGGDIRVGYGEILTEGATIDGVASPGAVELGVRRFEGSDREAFFDKLYNGKLGRGTPLRRTVDDIGQYFSRTDHCGPSGDNPGADENNDGILDCTVDSRPVTDQLSCRQNYHVMITDGYWTNGATDNNAINRTDRALVATGNVDNTTGPTILPHDGENDVYQYQPEAPYQDGYSNTLADAAMYYWNHDLRPDLPNKVPTNLNDEAYWQHVVQFTIGLDVIGTLNQEDYDISNGVYPTWPNANQNPKGRKIDDLWHAAVNGHGSYFNASDPDELAQALSDTFHNIAARISSASAIATNSTRLDTDTFVYQARFNGERWSGELRAFLLNQQTGDILDSNPGLDGIQPEWEASALLDSRGDVRNLFTYDSTTNPSAPAGKDFYWNDLSVAQQNFLKDGGSDADGQDRLDYLRGDRTGEGTTYRDRASRLGDIVNSDPFFVGKSDFGYNILPDTTEADAYVTFRQSTQYQARPGIVYVGANDGMLHAFESDTGVELFAYVPEMIFPDLHMLTEKGYTHKYFVDGPSKAGDAYVDGAWKSVLIGTMGGGGKGVFALDVTYPAAVADNGNITVNFDKTDVMWEFTNATDSDLGYTIGQASVVRMYDGTWAAVFGNGYESDDDEAVLFIVNLEDPTDYVKFETQVGSAASPNGMTTPTPVDIDGDRVVDAIYVGDLHGNMWAIDVTDTRRSQWKFKYGNSNNPAPLFTALDASDNAQPITSKPAVNKHPDGGVMLFFGTGKYFEKGDNVSLEQMTFYGIRDDDAQISDRSELVEQEITHELVQDFTNPDTNETLTWGLRASTTNPVEYNCDNLPSPCTESSGWYMELKSPVNGWEGERVVSAPLLRENRIVFVTMIPDEDPCEFGGDSWLMELSAVDGKRLSISPFDLNNDGSFSSADYITIIDDNGQEIHVPASGKKSKEGIIKTPGIVKTEDREFKYVSGSSGGIEMTVESRSARPGRQSWIQYR